MLSKTAIVLAAASITVGAFATAPAMANYAPCVENPSGPGCPGEIKQPMTHSNYYRSVERPTVPATRHYYHHG